MDRKFLVGRWRWKFLCEWRWRYQAIGVSFNFHSWRNLYPWFDAGVFLGPLMLKIEWVQPPATED